MQDRERRPDWPSLPVVLLCLLFPPAGLLAWILGHAEYRAVYLRSLWVKTGIVLLVVGLTPLLLMILASAIGLWPEENPNPIGAGLLSFVGGLLSTFCMGVGVLRIWWSLRSAGA